MADNPQSGGNRCGARISRSVCHQLATKFWQANDLIPPDRFWHGWPATGSFRG